MLGVRMILKGGGEVKQRLTITEVAGMLGVSPKTLARWERVGKIRRPKRDWRGWRVYEETDVQQIKEFHEAVFEA
jgi:DNA-binding transcriptional MerR regulator